MNFFKRNYSSSSSDTAISKKTLPLPPPPQNIQIIYYTRNRSGTSNLKLIDRHGYRLLLQKNQNVPVHIKPRLPISLKGILEFSNFCSALIALIGIDNFFCKTSGDRLRIHTANTDSYLVLIRYLKESDAEYHTYQLREDKPTPRLYEIAIYLPLQN